MGADASEHGDPVGVGEFCIWVGGWVGGGTYVKEDDVKLTGEAKDHIQGAKCRLDELDVVFVFPVWVGGWVGG